MSIGVDVGKEKKSVKNKEEVLSRVSRFELPVQKGIDGENVNKIIISPMQKELPQEASPPPGLPFSKVPSADLRNRDWKVK